MLAFGVNEKMCNVKPIVQVLFVILVCVPRRGFSRESSTAENDVLEKSEVVFKFPVYSIRMPPALSSRGRGNVKVDPMPISCTSKNVTRALSELRKKILCIPRDTVVEISAVDGSTVAPAAVVVKRCGGMCSGGKKCMSAKKEMVEFYVRTTHERSSMVFCNIIKLHEDTECKCGCVKKKKSCLPIQKFDSNLCKCICTNQDEYQTCIENANLNFKWNASTCSCGCKHEKICTTGSIWNQSKCRCVKL